ncbi:MAG: VIT domain-containing protein [Chloroflexota bacterium]
MDTTKKRVLILQVFGFLITVIAALLLSPTTVKADGVIIPDPPPVIVPEEERDAWLTIRYHHVDVEIDGQIALTHVEQEFLNEQDWEVEGTYLFPLPKGATISEFKMWVGGKPVEAKILPAEEARQVYEDIVRRRRDPALLEYVGRNAVQVRIYPIPPGGTRKVELEYSQILENEGGLVEYVYPLSTEKYSARPLASCSIHVEIGSDLPLHAIYSPTHHGRIFLDRKGDRHALVSYEETDVLPEEDFELIYTVDEEKIGLNVLTYLDQGGSGANEDGYFLLLASPLVEVDQVIPRDIVFVLDTSGSMEGQKISQAKDALTYVLQHLNEGDRFNVIAFSSGIERYAAGLRPVSESDQAVRWLEGLEALGGTDINRGLLEAFSSLEKGREAGPSARPAVILYLTDGLPTEGVTDVQGIIDNAMREADPRLRMFPFGVGDDVNTILLDTLAENHHGTTAYVRPQESIAEEVSGLYAKIQSPVLTDIKIDFGEILAEDLYPRTLPDLFAGSQLILTGRYRLPAGSGQETEIVLSGKVDGQEKDFTYQASFPGREAGGVGEEEAESYIPRLWATRKIGYFMTQIRLHGEREEWVQAIVDLSVRYGIITPYTSFLIDEEDILTQKGQEEAAREFAAQPSLPAFGQAAAEKAEMEGHMRSADSVPSQPNLEGSAGEGGGRVLKYAGSKTFLLRDGIWTDTTFDPERMETKKIGFGNEVYFQVLASRPAWGTYFSVGNEVIFVADGQAYQVVEGEGESIDVPPVESPVESTPGPRSPLRFPSFKGLDLICPGTLVIGFFILGFALFSRQE